MNLTVSGFLTCPDTAGIKRHDVRLGTHKHESRNRHNSQNGVHCALLRMSCMGWQCPRTSEMHLVMYVHSNKVHVELSFDGAVEHTELRQCLRHETTLTPCK